MPTIREKEHNFISVVAGKKIHTRKQVLRKLPYDLEGIMRAGTDLSPTIPEDPELAAFPDQPWDKMVEIQIQEFKSILESTDLFVDQEIRVSVDSFGVTATEFRVDPQAATILTADLLMRNRGAQALGGLAIELISAPLSQTQPVFEPVPEIAPNSSASVSLSLGVDNQVAGRIAKLDFIPNAALTLSMLICMCSHHFSSIRHARRSSRRQNKRRSWNKWSTSPLEATPDQCCNPW
jgi:hypothetical protein